MSLRIDSSVKSQSLDTLIPYITHPNEYFDRPAGEEHYRLLAHISNQLPNGSIVADIGTSMGLSALALSINEKIKVISYDILDTSKYTSKMATRPNIEFIIKDALTDIDKIKSSSVILLDIDPHDGIQEKAFIAKLEEAGYKGLVFCDDINLNDGMKSWWAGIKQEKADVTAYGHWSGTGVIFFQ